MPIKRTKQKIADLREQPEHHRLRAVSITAITLGIIIGLVWLLILLPLQVYFN